MTNNHYRMFPDLPNKQHGVVLIIALIMLLIMSIIGITAMSTNTLEERMAANLKDKNTALQAGEAALREMEIWLVGLLAEPSTKDTLADCTTPPCDIFNATSTNPSGPPLPDISQQSHTWWLANGREYGVVGTKDIPGVSDDPRFVTELIRFSQDNLDPEAVAKGEGNFFYRVTARGTGGSEDTQSIVQITIRRRFN